MMFEKTKGQRKKSRDLTSIKTLFSTDLKFSERVINIDSSKTLQQDSQTDLGFINDLLHIREHSKNLEKESTAKRLDLKEQQYQFIEETGQLHYEANIFNETSFLNQQEIIQEDKCPCGCKRAKGENLPFCINIQKQSFFGQGIILFFYFSTRVLFLMFPIILIYGVYSLITNLINNGTTEDCTNPGALAFLCQFKIDAQILNKQGKKQLVIPEICLGLLMCFVWSVGLRLIRRLGMIKGQKIDDTLLSASDFVLFLEKMPISSYSENEVIDYLKKLWQQIDNEEKTPLRIKGIEIIYNMNEFRAKVTTIRELAKTLLTYLSKKQLAEFKRNVKEEDTLEHQRIRIQPKFIEDYITKKEELINIYEQALEYRENFINSSLFRSKLSSECALALFEDEDQLQTFLDHYSTNKKTWIQNKIAKLKKLIWKNTQTLEFKGRQIRMYKAPEPSDIFWSHCEKKVRVRRTLIVWMLNLILTGLSFGFLYLLKWVSSQNPQIQGLSILTIIGVNLFNRLIWNILLNIVFIQQNYTKTINLISVMNKSYFSQIVNLIFIPIILNVVVNDNIYGATGLSGQVHDFQLTAFLFMMLFNLINVPHRIVSFIRCVKPLRRLTIKYLCRVTGDLDTFDEIRDALVFLYDPPLVPVAGLYVYITTVISQAVFFCHLQPILLFYLLGNLVLFFLINKYLVLRMSKITDLIDITVFHHVANLTLNISLLYGVGSITFLALSETEYEFGFYVPSILCIVVWFLSIQSPFNLFSRLVDCIIKRFILTEDKYGDKERQRKQKEQTKQTRSVRKQNYFGAIGTNQIFNFQNKLQEVKGKYHGQLEQFCCKFKSSTQTQICFISLSESKENLRSADEDYCEIVLE